MLGLRLKILVMSVMFALIASALSVLRRFQGVSEFIVLD
jgi:hypothetical protein